MWQTISGALGVVIIIGGAFVALWAKKKDLTRETLEKNCVAQKELITTRDLQLVDKNRDLELLTAEHKQLIQVMVKEVVTGWQAYSGSKLLLDNARLRREIQEQRTLCNECQTYIESNTVPRKSD